MPKYKQMDNISQLSLDLLCSLNMVVNFVTGQQNSSKKCFQTITVMHSSISFYKSLTHLNVHRLGGSESTKRNHARQNTLSKHKSLSRLLLSFKVNFTSIKILFTSSALPT